jgi:SAM-dependent methyltransferase
LVAVYETINAYEAGTQPDFYLQLASDVGATSVVDLGCGTGMITRQFARRGYSVIGIDPSPAMIQIARERPGGEGVHWIVGGADRLGTPDADLAFMSGHVAQFFLTDDDWRAALTALHRALRDGGRLAFESRNPGAREWEQWTRNTSVVVDDPVAGRIETWSEVHDVRDHVVSYSNHYLFAATGDDVVSPSSLRFRTLEQLNRSLDDAGFEIEHVYGDWDRRPADPSARELIVVATR